MITLPSSLKLCHPRSPRPSRSRNFKGQVRSTAMVVSPDLQPTKLGDFLGWNVGIHMHHGNFMGCIWVMLNHENHVGFMVNWCLTDYLYWKTCEKSALFLVKFIRPFVLVFNNIEAERLRSMGSMGSVTQILGISWMHQIWGFNHHGRMSFPWPKTWKNWARSSGDQLVDVQGIRLDMVGN